MTVKWDTYNEKMKCTPTEYIKVHARERDADILQGLKKYEPKATIEAVRYKRKQLGLAKNRANGQLISKSEYIQYTNPIIVTESCCVLADVEAPFHHAEFINKVFNVCLKRGIKHLVLAGDFLHHDSLSGFDPNWVEDTKAKIPEEVAERLKLAVKGNKKAEKQIEELIDELGVKQESAHSGISKEWASARQFLNECKSIFSSATAVLGNHEGRFLRVVDSPMAPTDLRAILLGNSDNPWMDIRPYYYCMVQQNGINWRITHPKNSSVIPASVGRRLSDKFECNVVQAHNHLLGVSQSYSGKYVAIETGCCVDGSRVAYYQQRDTIRPVWALGATLIENGYATLLSENLAITDWSKI